MTLSIFRNKNFARLFSAGAASMAGFAIGQIAMIWEVDANTGSSTASALPIAYIGVSFEVASVVFSLVAGALVDRHERRRLMVLSDLVRAGALATLAVILTVGGYSLFAILLTAFVLGSFTTLFQPAERALTPEVVGNEQLADANALVQTSNSILQFASNSVGAGMIAAVGVIAAFGLNTFTFLMSAVLIAGMVGLSPKQRQRTADLGKHPSLVQDISEGFGYIVRNRALLELTLSAGIGNFFLSMVFQFFVVYATVALGGGVLVFGIVNGFFALGWAPGAYISAKFQTVQFAGKIWIFSGVLTGICILALVAFPYFVPAAVFAFLMGILLGLANTTWLTAVQLIVPTEMQGRYFGLDQLGSFAVIPVGQILGGVIIAASGVGVDFLIAGVGTAAGAGVFYLSPYLRNLGWKKPGSSTEGTSSAGGGTLAPLEGGIRTHESR